jgi:dTDP-4-amino-4,6-dideoxygalactose transaminase
MIRFNKPYLSGKEIEYITEAVHQGKLSGNKNYTKQCQSMLKSKYGFRHCLLTTSCTDALEMTAILANIKEGDEIIMPSFTFVSTANPFLLRGATIRFADSYANNNPNIDPDNIEELITPKTKAIVVVHYAGIACDMDKIKAIAKKHDLLVIEDAAQAIDSFYNGVPLGTLGNMSAFSFHETKNIICGEGGLLVVNDEDLVLRSEIIWEKGTNRSAFFRGEIDKYGWMDIGSSYLMSDILSAFLYAQLENLDAIQSKRKEIWQKYYAGFEKLENEKGTYRPLVPKYATQNGHLFYLVCKDLEERSKLIAHLKQHDIHSVFHYQSLHDSKYFESKHDGRDLPNSDQYSNSLVRLPLYYELTNDQVNHIIDATNSFYGIT